MQYIIEDILDADFGCEEREEGTPLMCTLALSAAWGSLSADRDPASEDADPGSAKCSHRQRIFRNIPDSFVEELHLQKGQVLSKMNSD